MYQAVAAVNVVTAKPLAFIRPGGPRVDIEG